MFFIMKNRAFTTEGGIDSISSPSWAEGALTIAGICTWRFINFLGQGGIICELVQYTMSRTSLDCCITT